MKLAAPKETPALKHSKSSPFHMGVMFKVRRGSDITRDASLNAPVEWV